MSLFLNNKGYINAGKLWKKYSDEELIHAGWAKEYLLSFGILPELRTIEQPDNEFTDLAQIIDLTYDHEIEVSKQCNELATCALDNQDHLLYSLANRYVKEQVEELDKAQTLKDQLESFGRDKIALRLLDHELADY
jgi:ferritin